MKRIKQDPTADSRLSRAARRAIIVAALAVATPAVTCEPAQADEPAKTSVRILPPPVLNADASAVQQVGLHQNPYCGPELQPISDPNVKQASSQRQSAVRLKKSSTDIGLIPIGSVDTLKVPISVRPRALRIETPEAPFVQSNPLIESEHHSNPNLVDTNVTMPNERLEELELTRRGAELAPAVRIAPHSASPRTLPERAVPQDAATQRAETQRAETQRAATQLLVPKSQPMAVMQELKLPSPPQVVTAPPPAVTAPLQELPVAPKQVAQMPVAPVLVAPAPVASAPIAQDAPAPVQQPVQAQVPSAPALQNATVPMPQALVEAVPPQNAAVITAAPKAPESLQIAAPMDLVPVAKAETETVESPTPRLETTPEPQPVLFSLSDSEDEGTLSPSDNAMPEPVQLAKPADASELQPIGKLAQDADADELRPIEPQAIASSKPVVQDPVQSTIKIIANDRYRAPVAVSAPPLSIASQKASTPIVQPASPVRGLQSKQPQKIAKARNAPTKLHMTRAQVRSLTIGGHVRRIDVGNHDVCQAIATGPNQLKLIGTGNGVTRLVVWADARNSPTRVRTFEIHVDDAVESTGNSLGSKTRMLNESIIQAFPYADISVQKVQDRLIVAGDCDSEEEAKKIIRMVRKTCLIPVRDEIKVR